MSSQWFIYVLKDPKDNAVRYVGKTIDPVSRLSSHISKARNGKGAHSAHWINKVLEDGNEPIMEIIDSGDNEDWQSIEKYWIAKYRDDGANLTNITDGGEGTEGYIVELEKVCKKCGATFIAHSEKSEYCDICCTFECIECGKVFYTRSYSRKKHPPLFCSSECYGKGKLPSWRTCKKCGKDFTSKSNFAKYCPKCKGEK